ncbi:hypothetical protein [Spiroplasma endosymbiont of Nebria brevicollis]|uniref:hypothetical protein n=1 Tax=Spiroplasma endosymbiont of Nebria brevicollis TaxID=3066284 RepID=UPI00313F3A15
MKTWIKTNLSKITLALALTGATTGTIGLIMGCVFTHNMENSYLEPNGEIVLGTTTIWWNKWDSPNETELYFAKVKYHDEDVKWDGTYTDNYFK